MLAQRCCKHAVRHIFTTGEDVEPVQGVVPNQGCHDGHQLSSCGGLEGEGKVMER